MEQRAFEKSFYNDFAQRLRGRIPWIPATWEEAKSALASELTSPLQLSEMEKNILFQVASAFRVGCSLIQYDTWIRPGLKGLPPQAIPTAGLQLLLYGVFLGLREWKHKLPETIKPDSFLSKIILHLETSEFAELRHALAHSGGDNGETFFRFDAKSQSIIISTRELRKNQAPCKIHFDDAIFIAFLWWVIFSEWFYISDSRKESNNL